MFGSRRSETLARSRWAAIGAAVAVSLGAGGAGWVAHAASTPTRPSLFVAITPCRLIDTHSNSGIAFGRHTPLGPAETYAMPVRGKHGACNLPTSAVSVVFNLTVDNPTASSFLTVFPGATTRPKTTTMRWVAKQTPVANGVTSATSGTGVVNFYNASGKANLVADVVGYYQADTFAGGARASGHVARVLTPTLQLVRAKNVLSMKQVAPGVVCLEFPPAISAAAVMMTVTPDDAGDTTSVTAKVIAHAEVGSQCGTNGLEVHTYKVNLAAGTVTANPESFYFVVA